MKEFQTILKELRRISNSGGRAALATVVDVKGSSYRLPGAKMLITERGETFGTISGGCLETDVLERTAHVLETGEPQVFTYDTGGRDDSVFGLNMGCNGVVRVLLEPARGSLYFDFVEDCFEKKQPGAVATLIAAEDEIDYLTGTRLFATADGFSETAFMSADFGQKLFVDVSAAVTDGRSRTEIYETPVADYEFFIEAIRPPLALTVFGAGADAIPLSRFAKDLGWRVTVVDHRPAFATKSRFPEVDEISRARPEKLKLQFDENSVAVVMTHNYEHDRQILQYLLKSKAMYVGALGPKRRTEQMLDELKTAGDDFSGEDLAKLYAPVGLDIGADTPESIALAIIAEIQAVLAQRAGGFLRNRQGSIYNRQSA